MTGICVPHRDQSLSLCHSSVGCKGKLVCAAKCGQQPAAAHELSKEQKATVKDMLLQAASILCGPTSRVCAMTCPKITCSSAAQQEQLSCLFWFRHLHMWCSLTSCYCIACTKHCKSCPASSHCLLPSTSSPTATKFKLACSTFSVNCSFHGMLPPFTFCLVL